jgi:hypothetical protein
MTPEAGVLDAISGRFLTTDSYLPLVEISVAGAPVAPPPLDDVFALPAPAEIFIARIILDASPSF